MTRYIIITWFLSNALHPVMAYVYLLFVEGDGEWIMDEIFVIAIYFFIIAFVLSIPALFLAYFSFKQILRLALGSAEKFILWIIAALSSVFINYCVVMFWASGELYLNLLWFIPAMVSVLIIIFIRYKSFFELNKLVTSGLNNFNNEKIS
jgi:hypothetical protein